MTNNILYKYVDIAGLKRILNGSIRFTQPSAFNDPYELLPELVLRKDALEEQVNLSFDITSQRRILPVGDFESFGEDYNSSDLTSRNIVKELNNLIGIFCLSKSPNSMLMWSHYADQYAGAVVGFDASHDFFYGQIDVEYLENRPRKELYSYLASPIPIAELCAKSTDWLYEQEVRVVRRLDDCHDTGKNDGRGFKIFIKSIPLECIKTITFGERTSVANQREIYSLVKNTEIGLSLSAIDNVGYKFRQENIKFQGPESIGLGPMVSPRTAHIFSHLNNQLGEMARWMINNHPLSTIVNNLVK